jgi:hypothetical protein
MNYTELSNKDINNYSNIKYTSYQDALIKSNNNQKFNQIVNEIDNDITKKLKKKVNDKDLKQINKDLSFKTEQRCYTCRPRGKVKKHIIGQSFCGDFIFHHDLNTRPVILMTPIQHFKSIQELSKEMLKNMFTSIEVFCGFWNIKDYQVSYNNGSWSPHEHFHVKIKIPDKIAIRMRDDHFKRITQEQEYAPVIAPVQQLISSYSNNGTIGSNI